MKNSIFAVLGIVLVVMIFILVSGGNKSKSNNKQESQNNQNQGVKTMENLKFPGILPNERIKNKKAVIKTEKGIIEFELLTDNAPKTVSNFVYLSELGFYNGLTFHRVEPNFVIQGGDPLGNGTGGPGYQFEDEKVIGDYKEGTVAMANSGVNTNGSQFFICLANLPNLPKQYNLFGQVTRGMDVVKQIKIGDKIESITIENK